MNLLESKTVLPDSNGVQSLTPALPPHLPSNGADLWPTEVKYIIPLEKGKSDANTGGSMSQPKVLIPFTLAETTQLLEYVLDRDRGDGCGWYYGNKEQFEARHSSIIDKINSALEDF